MLEQIFKRQLELMEKYHDIEARSGIFNYQDDGTPVNLTTVGGQARIKHLAWYTVEEIAEALDGKDKAQQQEELVDALHFFVELCIASGYNYDFFEPLELMFGRVKRFHSDIDEGFLAQSVTKFIYALGNAMNRLKNKPWKQTPVPVDIPAYEGWLTLAMFHFIQIAWAYGIHQPQQLVDLYMGKAKVNQQRQESGY